MTRLLLAAVAAVAMPPGVSVAQVRPATDAQMTAVAEAVTAAVKGEIADKAMPSIAVALVDRSGVIWSGAWGTTDAGGKQRATPATVYRAGSISKLFTDVAIMRLVEQGRLDLDAPVTRYLPSFRPRNPFGVAITLRQLMTHRSGLVREPPRGHYFDDRPRGQADAVASLNATTLVARPGTVTKYSNAGIAVVGEVVASITGQPFETAVTQLVLKPLGMRASTFARPASVAHAQMASFDGGRWAAPAFDLGTPAAGSLYATVGDLGRFVQAMLNRGALPAGRVLSAASLTEMWRDQYPGSGGRRFGLGFALGTLDGQATVGHGGAVYGHVTDLRLMPDAGIGVVAFGTVDSGPVARRIGGFALSALNAVRQGKPLPVWRRSQAISGAAAIRLSGRYVDGTDSVTVRPFDGALVLDAPELAGEVRQLGDAVILDDAQLYDDRIAFAADATSLTLAGRRFVRADPGPRPAGPPPQLAGLIGEYGWDYNVLRIYQRDGTAYARIEWTDWLPLTPNPDGSYAFPVDRGLYPREALTFERDAAGKVTAALLGAIRFPRRDFGAEGEAAIRAAMATGMAELRANARKATPPVEPAPRKASDLVAIRAAEPAIALDIRYAGTDNFMGQQIYEQSGAFLQRPATAALARIHAGLAKQGFGLLIHDAYRPWYVTRMFWDATPERNRMFVADPSKGSRHNRGAAVDLTMIDLATGNPVTTTGRYDEFSSRSYTNYVGGSDEQRWLRETLRTAMEREGFTVYPQEWWHFDLVGWHDYPIGNRSFAELPH